MALWVRGKMSTEGKKKLVRYMIVIFVFATITFIFFGGYNTVRDWIVDMTDDQLAKFEEDRDYVSPQDALDRVDPETFKNDMTALTALLKQGIDSEKQICFIDFSDIVKTNYMYPGEFKLETAGSISKSRLNATIISSSGRQSERIGITGSQSSIIRFRFWSGGAKERFLKANSEAELSTAIDGRNSFERQIMLFSSESQSSAYQFDHKFIIKRGNSLIVYRGQEKPDFLSNPDLNCISR